MSDIEDRKRELSDSENSCNEEFPGPKKSKQELEEDLYLDNLPSCTYYEKSYMHRDFVSHVLFTKKNFLITASVDGRVKFWKKLEEGIEFVKTFRVHQAAIADLAENYNGTLMCTASKDKSFKIFDVVSFDCINMIKLDFVPNFAEFMYRSGDAIEKIAISDSESSKIYIYDCKQPNSTEIHLKTKIHINPVTAMKYNPRFDTMISTDKDGIINYWTGSTNDYAFPECVNFKSKIATDLFDIAKAKTYPVNICISPDGLHFAVLCSDKIIRVFNFLTGKIKLVQDESTEKHMKQQKQESTIAPIEFFHKVSVEQEMEKNDVSSNILFDESGRLLVYTNIFGVQIFNIVTRKVSRILGTSCPFRPLKIALFQGKITQTKAALTIETEAAENPTLDSITRDPTIFCTAYKRNRFYMFTNRVLEGAASNERDVINEEPTEEDIIAAKESSGAQRIFGTAILHTSMGDVHLKLFMNECPKTVENFCVLAKDGYYNGHIFHRVIKSFMIQTGDPTGTGTGGKSIWGGEFEDEFHPSLRHDRPYTLSMANAGPNTNGSQFFITVTNAPWLDGKHTVFGRVVKGMEVAQSISNVNTNPKTDKPYDDVQIISVTVK